MENQGFKCDKLDSNSKDNQRVYNQVSHAPSRIPMVPCPNSISPWTSQSIPNSIPTLPKVLDSNLELAAFTHAGLTSPKNPLSYERLEWTGDAYIYLLSTLLISATFTAHLPGPSSQIREKLVKNETLAGYAKQYGFESRARLPPDFSITATVRERQKVMGDMFEAYVAAILLSDPTNGVQTVAQWLKALWSMTIAKEIRDQERVNKQAPQDDDHLNAKEKLAKKLISPGIKVNYKEIAPQKRDPESGGFIFTVGVFLDGWGEQDKQLAFGRGKSKKDAGFRAAEMALQNYKLISTYENMKKEHDAKKKAERDAAGGL
jgi:ribonuclease-3